MTDEQGHGIDSEKDTEGIPGGVLKLGGFIEAQPSVAGNANCFGKLVCVEAEDFFGCGVLGKQFKRRFPKGVGEKAFVLREHLVEEGDDLALDVRNGIHNVKAVTA